MLNDYINFMNGVVVPDPEEQQFEEVAFSEVFKDDKYEYRNVTITTEMEKDVPTTHLMTETEWRNLGVEQSPGWVHYMWHDPEPEVLLFRRSLDFKEDESDEENTEG